MVTELEERVATLEAGLAQALEIGSRHGDQHSSPEGSDPAPGFFISVPTANDLPTTRPAPTLYKVTGPPVLLYMVDPDGQREIGWSAHAASDADATLANDDVGEANAEDISNATVTLPKPGNYVIVAVFDFTATVGIASSAVGILREADNTVVDTPRGAIFNPAATGDRVTVTQTWRFTSTTDNEVLKLSAYHTITVHQFTVNETHTTIAAWAGLGGDTTSASHTHTHAQATSQTKSDHHVALTSLDIGGVPIVPDTGDAINLVAGANISLAVAPNELTITASGGGGSGPHTLLSTTHTDTDAAQQGSAGDIIIRNNINQWDNLAHPGVPNSFLISGGSNPQWLSASLVATGIASLISHGDLVGLEDDDHVIYPTKNGVELITGLWQFDREVIFDAIASPSSPPINSGVLYTEVSGTDILLRWKSPTGAVCTICTETNTSITATVSFLMMGIKQA